MALPGIAPYDLPRESDLPKARGPWQPRPVTAGSGLPGPGCARHC